VTAEDARRAAERAARVSYGRLLAILGTRTRDIAAAEDGLAEAFAAALRTWPDRGVPANPDAWLLTAARNTLLNDHRHRQVRDGAAAEIARGIEEANADGERPFPDERLKLLFVCAHPAIDPAIRTPLMLQTVLGLDAARIGEAFLVPAATMGQRLVRAKAKIRDAGLRFEVPEPEAFADRVGDVLDAIYAAFGTGWDAVPGADEGPSGLVEEALWLGRLVAALLPAEPEAKGLLSLMLHCEARRAARRTADGGFVPLAEQDARLWSRDRIIEAEALLTAASRAGRFGRYQCEAAIQSVHAQRPITGRTNHAALATLYDLLAAHASTVGVLVARAAARLDAGDAAGALAALDALPFERTERYQPWHVVRMRALDRLGRTAEAAAAADRALALTTDPGVRSFLAATGAAGHPAG
jgi:RNA polymerase sigma-70 factor (ECF subfamily)